MAGPRVAYTSRNGSRRWSRLCPRQCFTLRIGGTIPMASAFGDRKQPPTSGLGAIPASALSFLNAIPQLVLSPEVTIPLDVFGFSLLGKSVRGAPDPRRRA